MDIICNGANNHAEIATVASKIMGKYLKNLSQTETALFSSYTEWEANTSTVSSGLCTGEEIYRWFPCSRPSRQQVKWTHIFSPGIHLGYYLWVPMTVDCGSEWFCTHKDRGRDKERGMVKSLCVSGCKADSFTWIKHVRALCTLRGIQKCHADVYAINWEQHGAILFLFGITLL